MGTYRLKVLLMDEASNDLYEEKGLSGVRKASETWANCEFKDYDFKTEAERNAYIQALYDMENGCWEHYAILDNRCRNF